MGCIIDLSGKYAKIKQVGAERFVRFKSLGESYDNCGAVGDATAEKTACTANRNAAQRRFGVGQQDESCVYQ